MCFVVVIGSRSVSRRKKALFSRGGARARAVQRRRPLVRQFGRRHKAGGGGARCFRRRRAGAWTRRPWAIAEWSPPPTLCPTRWAPGTGQSSAMPIAIILGYCHGMLAIWTANQLNASELQQRLFEVLGGGGVLSTVFKCQTAISFCTNPMTLLMKHRFARFQRVSTLS